MTKKTWRSEKAKSSEEEEDIVDIPVESDYDSEEQFFDDDLKNHFPPLTDRQVFLHLRDTWEDINPPVTEKDIVGRFFAAVYYHTSNRQKSGRLFVGKVVKRFLADKDGQTQGLELDCWFGNNFGRNSITSKSRHRGI